jgi:hypothetical protein
MSNPISGYFIIKLPTKAYLKKYLQTLYGTLVSFSTRDYFGMSIASALENPLRIQHRPCITKIRFDTFDTILDIKAPRWWLEKYQFGHVLNEHQVITINKLFETKFEDDLYNFCTQLSFVGVETKIAILQFCDRFNIEIDVDVTYEALKKKEYRFRKNLEKNTAQLSREGTRKILIDSLMRNLKQVG